MKSTKILTHLGSALGLFALISGSAQAGVITLYNTEADWMSSVSSYYIEDFEDDILASPLTGITGDDVHISGGKLRDVVDKGFRVDTIFSFNPGIYGAGGYWDLAGPGGQGTGIIIGSASDTHAIGFLPGSTDGFWGFTTDEIISDIRFINGFNPAHRETYTLDNLLMTTSAVGSVPEPATLALIGIGLVAVGFSRRKRNAKV